MVKVYIASPYTNGDVACNVKLQLDIANELIEKEFAPFVPLYSHFQHMVHPQPYDTWIALDLEWVKVCDCVLRVGSYSEGADNEVEFATKLGKKVFYSIDKLMEAYV